MCCTRNANEGVHLTFNLECTPMHPDELPRWRSCHHVHGGTTGEGTCSYLLPLSHRDVGIFATSATLVNTGSTNGFSMPNAVVRTIFQSIFYEYLLDINIPQGDLGKMIFKTILTRCKLCMSAKLNLRKFPLREVCTSNENHNGLGLGLILIP